MKGIKTGREEGKRAARYFGTEFQANPGSSRMEYMDSIAAYYGFDRWRDMPKDLREEASKEFSAGIAAEKKAVSGS